MPDPTQPRGKPGLLEIYAYLLAVFANVADPETITEVRAIVDRGDDYAAAALAKLDEVTRGACNDA